MDKGGDAGPRGVRSIRWHLLQVLLLGIVPLGVLAGALLYFHWQVQEAERERSQIESVRLLATAIDNALDSTVQRVSILSRLWASGEASEERLYRQAKAALTANPDWKTIVVFRADGQGVFRADLPFGALLPSQKLFDLWQPVMRERRPVISDLFVSPTTGQPQVAVGVPVVRDGEVTHIMIANLNLRWFDELLQRQGLPSGGVAGIFDRNWKFVSRSFEGDERRGTDPSAPLVADMKRNPEGIGRYPNLNGVHVYTSWTRSRHGWWVASATPSAAIDNAFWRHLAAFTLAWLAAVGAGVAYAYRKARRIAGALVSFEARAEDLAAGRTLGAVSASGVRELDRSLDALGKASSVLQQALEQRDASLAVEREARSAAEAASRSKDEFLAMLGHELRNPLAAISNASVIVNSPGRTAEQLAFAGGILARQSQHLKRLIDDLLDVGRVMTGKILHEHETLDLAATARRVASTLETAGRLAQRRFDVDAEAVWINGDPTRVEQIVANLLVNAATYTPAGGRIRLRVAREGGQALIEVSDNGIGIAPEHLGRIFDLFYQADATVDRARGGLGIGLTLVQRLVELHGGSVLAHSGGRGLGSTFTVRIPAVAAPSQEGEPSRAQARGGMPLEILVVEDNVDERQSLRMALELQGHRVVEAGNGHVALEIARRRPPQVAIVDIGLPAGMDGYTLAGVLRAELGDRILLVALTGYGGREDERRARDAGFDRHLTKPANRDELLDALKTAQGARAPLAPARAALADR
jgi:signal transduction histidine kinase/ActR/RegA family two-component response regulator